MKKNHIMTLAIVLGSLVIGGTTVGILILNQPPDRPPIDCEIIQVSGDYFLPNTGFESTKLEVINMMDHLSVSFSLLPEDSEHILTATWEISHFNWSLPIDYEFELQITEEEVDGFLVIRIDYDNETIPTWVTGSTITILINPTYSEYRFSSFGKTGNLDVVFDTKRELVFSKMEAFSTYGDIFIQLNHTILDCGVDVESVQGDITLLLDLLPITGDVNCHSLSGEVQIDFWDINFMENQSLTAISKEGTTSIRWAQHTQKSHQVNITAEAYYNCYLRIWCPIEFVRYDAASMAEDRCDFIGKTSDDWVEIEPDRYISSNFNDTTLDFFQASLTSLAFSTYIYFTNCFKPERFCGRMGALDILGYDVFETGEYIIPTENFTGTEVLLTDFTAYSNTSINITISEVNSTNLLEVYWTLTYHTGGDSGWGLLQIDFSYEIIDSVLHISLDLEYEEDRIRPIYTDGEIQIKIHPDYDFSLVTFE